MSVLNRYEIYQCDTCNRKTSFLIDPLRPRITNCNITYKCTGTLHKIGESGEQPSFPKFDDNLENWKQRGNDKSEIITIGSQNINILSGQNHIAICVPSSISTSLTLNYSIKKAEYINYTEYSYNRDSGATYVTGPDDSVYSRSLLINSNDNIKVYLNGVLLDETEYTYTNNMVTFNNPLSESNNTIKIIVYPIQQDEIRSFVFNKVCDSNSAWSNIESINFAFPAKEENSYDVFISEITNVQENDELTFIELLDDNGQQINGYLLLAYSPFSPIDRILDIVISLDNLNIKYLRNTYNQLELITNQDKSLSLLNPIHLVKCEEDVIDSTKINENINFIDNKYLIK